MLATARHIPKPIPVCLIDWLMNAVIVGLQFQRIPSECVVWVVCNCYHSASLLAVRRIDLQSISQFVVKYQASVALCLIHQRSVLLTLRMEALEAHRLAVVRV